MTGDQLSIGMSAERSFTITKDDIRKFGEVSKDENPMHFDEEWAKTTRFGGIIAHGLIGIACCGSVMTTDLPGLGNVHLGQTVTFKAPIYPGDTITCRAEIINITKKPKFYVVDLKQTVTNQNGVLLMEGVSTIMPPVTPIVY